MVTSSGGSIAFRRIQTSPTVDLASCQQRKMKSFFILCIGVVSAGVPDGISGILSKVDSIAANSGNAPDAASADAAAQSELGIFQEGLTSQLTLNALDADAYLLTRQAVAKLAHTGGCPRAYSYDCPAGWLQSGSGCAPPASYDGPCGTIAGGMDAAAKEDAALSCQAGWPCENAAPLNFSACPRGWTAAAGGVCTAPASYDGICGHATNFSSMSVMEKATWASMCSAQFPAGAGESVGAYVELKADREIPTVEVYNH